MASLDFTPANLERLDKERRENSKRLISEYIAPETFKVEKKVCTVPVNLDDAADHFFNWFMKNDFDEFELAVRIDFFVNAYFSDNNY